MRAASATNLLRVLLAGACGVAVALLVSCGSSNAKLIPIANAGPLQNDFEAIAQEAEAGNGNCAATEAAIAKAEQDFAALPPTLDPGLHSTLRQGIENLRSRALSLCAQPLVQTTTSSAPRTATTTTTTTPTVTTTTTPTTPPPTTTPSTPNQGGGTPAPGGAESPPGTGAEGGTGAGGGTGGAGGAGAVVGQEPAK